MSFENECNKCKCWMLLCIGTGITAYTLHPGSVRTELQREVPYIDTTIGSNVFYYLTWPVFKEPWNGAQTTICCAVDESLANESGKYYRLAWILLCRSVTGFTLLIKFIQLTWHFYVLSRSYDFSIWTFKYQLNYFKYQLNYYINYCCLKQFFCCLCP